MSGSVKNRIARALPLLALVVALGACNKDAGTAESGAVATPQPVKATAGTIPETNATNTTTVVQDPIRVPVDAAALGSVNGSKPNIILIIGDDVGWGDLGVYGGGANRGIPTPNLDRLADEGMTFFSFYAQPSCTAGRAAMQTGRNPNRSGMTTVAFQGQGGGLPAAEWTLASMLKTADYNTYFTGKWHLGEEDYSMPNAQGYDDMKYVGLYHLNAYTYSDPTWFPDMSDEMRAMFKKVTKGSMSGKAGEPATEDFAINGQYVNKPNEKTDEFPNGVVGIPYFDSYVQQAALDYLDTAKASGKPFFLNVNFMKLHQPSMPAPEFQGKSLSKNKYADSAVEMDARVGTIMDKVRALGLDKNTLVIFTTDNGAWQDVYPDAGYTPFRGTKGTVREGGNRVPAIAWMPGKIKAGARNSDIIGGLDFMATFAALAGVDLPTKDRDGKGMVFDSFDQTPVLFGTGPDKRKAWFYFTENELTPGAVRVGQFKAVFNLRGDNGQATGGLEVDSNLGWKGPEKYVAMVPNIYDLWQDPQERYNIFMNSYTEHTWTLVTFNAAIAELMKTYKDNPPRKMQGEGYNGPITLTGYQRFKYVRDSLSEEGVNIGMPSGN